MLVKTAFRGQQVIKLIGTKYTPSTIPTAIWIVCLILRTQCYRGLKDLAPTTHASQPS